MVAPSSIFFISFEIKPHVTSSDSSTKKRIITTFCFQIAKIVRCYCHDLGQSGRNIFDFSLCVLYHSILQLSLPRIHSLYRVYAVSTVLDTRQVPATHDNYRLVQIRFSQNRYGKLISTYCITQSHNSLYLGYILCFAFMLYPLFLIPDRCLPHTIIKCQGRLGEVSLE